MLQAQGAASFLTVSGRGRPHPQLRLLSAAEPRLARALVRVHLHARASRRRLAADRAVRAWRARALVHIHVAVASRGAVADVHVARRRVLRDVAVRAHAVGEARDAPTAVRIRSH